MIMRRLFNKKGSVLFLVVVVMSILIIAASATFYIVNNQHSSVNIRYSSEQSYQTAVSVTRTVSDYIDGYIAALGKSGKEMSDYKDTIIGKMLGMSTGTSNDITSDIPLDNTMGSAKVTIRKKAAKPNGDDTIHLFEITTEAEVNGETVSITQVKEIVTGPTEYFTRFLTSTGKHPDDVNITANKIISGAYFENDFTRLSNVVMNDSFYSSGTFYNDGINFNAPTKEIVVAENFYDMGWGNPITCDKIYVGGNMECTSQLNVSDLCILGDLTLSQDQGTSKFYINGDCYINNSKTEGCVFYVNGSVYFNNISKAQGKFYVKKDVIINNWVSNNVQECKYGGSMIGSTPATGFTNDPDIAVPFSNTGDVTSYIASATGKQKYEEWQAETYFVKTFTNYVENVSADYSTYDIKNAIVPGDRADTWIPTDDPADEPSWINGSAWKPDGTSAVLNQKHSYISDTYGNGTAICYITESCALRSWSNVDFSGVNSWDNYTTAGGCGGYIVIDTGPQRANGKELYILLDKGANSYFSFGSDNTIQNVNVIIKGDYPVIFILPNGTPYKASSFMYIGHANLAVEMCGCVDYSDLVSVKRANANGISSVFTDFTGAAKVAQIESYIETIPAANAKSQPTALIKSGTGIPDFHNNIYLVSNSMNDVINMETENFFYGYVYAPNSKFWVNAGGGGQEMIQFLGGMIVGSYYYDKFGAALAYLTPCDYKDVYGLTKKTEIVKKLMSIASGSAPGGADPYKAIIKPSTGVSPTIGYK